MNPEYHQTPLVCENEPPHSYRDRVEWKIHYVEESARPTNQEPEIRTPCRVCGYPLKVEGGWLPH
jgi:hypothetical protein